MSEQEIQSAILAALDQLPGVVAWRSNVDHRGRVKCGKTGQGDITGLIRGGRRLEVEVKGPRGVQSPAQIAFQTMIEHVGGLYVVARSVDDVLDALKREGVVR